MPDRSATASTAVSVADILKVGAYNTAIALLLTTANDHGLVSNLIYSQAIGYSIYGAIVAVCLLRGGGRPRFLDAAIGVPAGTGIGIALGTWANGMTLTELLQRHPQAVIMSATAALLFGLIASGFTLARTRLDEARGEAETERRLRAEQEALASQAELRLLQSRIEPHFLFNTLSVIVELIDSRPAAGRSMLLNLVTLLRGALANTRRESVTLDQELDLLRAYLEIMAERMGPRLRYRIEVDDAARLVRLPPLLVQPLVENAIRHGLEPIAEGGEVAICCTRQGDTLQVEVGDSGRGLAAAAPGSGIGLANVRERLAARFGAAGRLELAERPGGGVVARVVLPVAP